MTNRNSLLGRSKPSEKLTGEQLAALGQGDRTSSTSRTPRAAGEAAWDEGRWYPAKGPQGSAEVSLEHRVP